MSEHLELVEAMTVSYTGPAELIYVPIGGPRVEPAYEEIDFSIRETVRWLFEHGFNPFDSEDAAYIFMNVRPPNYLEEEVDRLHRLLVERGVNLFDGPATPEEAEEIGVPWEDMPENSVKGSLQGSYSPGGPAIIVLDGVNDKILGG